MTGLAGERGTMRTCLWRLGLVIACVAGLAPRSAAAPTGRADGHWVGAWVSAQQLVEPANMPPAPGLSGNTLRQIVQPTADGPRVRLTFSNVYGDGPVTIAGAHLARSKGGASIDASTDRVLSFGGQPGVTIPLGSSIISDPIEYEVQAFENLAVSVWCGAVPRALTGHPGSRTTSFLRTGDGLADAEFAGAGRTDHWYLLAAVDVWSGPEQGAVVVVGDSITDGRGSTTNANDRWPNQLARRLRADPRTAGVSVLNQGIGGNRVLGRGLGPSALERFDRDVLAPAGVRCLVIFEGVNDLGAATGARAKGLAPITPGDIILAYQQMIVRARSHGLRVIGATIMPFSGFQPYEDARSEADRQAVNAWIRSSGEFDAVIDFDAITRDPANPAKLLAAVDGGDHLHPSAAGYKLMAEAIDLAVFSERR
jgi:lysophospholipase L1-like esterase